MRSDVYLEKVDRWMDQIDQWSKCDTFSVDSVEMLNYILHNKMVDNQPYLSMSQCVTNKPSVTAQDLSSPVSTVDVSSDVFQLSNNTLISEESSTKKMRLLSADSGVDVEYDKRNEQNLTVAVHCHPLLEIATPISIGKGSTEQIVSDVRKVECSQQQTSNSPVSTISACSYDQNSDFSEKSIAGMSHYFDPEAEVIGEKFDGGNCTMQQIDNPNSAKVHSENNELTLTVTVSDNASVEATGGNFGDIFKHNSTQETGMYVGFEDVNETIGILETDELQLKVEHDTKKECDTKREHDGVAIDAGSILSCHPLLVTAENASVDKEVPQQIVKDNNDVRKVERDEQQQTIDNMVSINSTISCSQKSIAGVPHYLDSETRERGEDFPYFLLNESGSEQQFEDPSNQAIVMEDVSKDIKVDSSDAVQQTDGYIGLEFIHGMCNNESDKFKLTMTVGESTMDDFDDTLSNKSTQEMNWFGFEDVNVSRGSDCNTETVTVGNYVESSYFESSTEKFKSDTDEILSSPKALRDSTDVEDDDDVGLRSTEAVGDYIWQDSAIIGDSEKSGDLSRHENSVDIGHPGLPAPVIIAYKFNSDGYIINHDYDD